jgi:hypothetical protein
MSHIKKRKKILKRKHKGRKRKEKEINKSTGWPVPSRWLEDPSTPWLVPSMAKDLP